MKHGFSKRIEKIEICESRNKTKIFIIKSQKELEELTLDENFINIGIKLY